MRGSHLAQPGECRIGSESVTEGEDRRGAAGEALGQQAAYRTQRAAYQADPAPQPAHGPRRFRATGTHRRRGGGHAREPFGRDHGVLEFSERTRQPRRQAVRQQTEGGVALGTVPAGDARAGWGLACVGAVPRQRAAATGMVRAAHQGCIAPALGRNVLLAGKPRPKTKLHPAAARRSHRPRGPTPLSCLTGSAYRAGNGKSSGASGVCRAARLARSGYALPPQARAMNFIRLTPI